MTAATTHTGTGLDSGSSNLPRVLYLCSEYPFPPATAGDAVYSRELIEALSNHCRLTVLCADSGSAHPPPPEIDWHLTEPIRTGRAGSVLSRWPLIAWKGARPDHHTAFRTLLSGGWDAIVLSGLGSAHALPLAERYRSTHPDTKLIYVSYEYEYPQRRAKYGSYGLNLPQRVVAARDLQKVRLAEEALLRRCDIVTVISHADLEPFRRIAPQRKYLPLLPGYSGFVVPDRRIDSDTPRRVLLLGGRRSEQKRRVLLDWMAVAHDRLGEAGIEMVVAGDIDEGLQAHLHTTYPDAQVLGFVEDLAGLFSSARMGIIADTVGGGFKLRLLPQVFQRLPIVGLRHAIDGLPTREGRGYLAAENLDPLVDLVCRVIDDTDRLNAVHEAAFSDCASSFSWSVRAEAFVEAVSGNEGGLL